MEKTAYISGNVAIFPELGSVFPHFSDGIDGIDSAPDDDSTLVFADFAAQSSQKLSRINMSVLACLLDASGQLVSRQALFDKVWKNQIVSDDTLTRSVSDLRSCLKKLDPKNAYIETLPKRGYRWREPVSRRHYDINQHEKRATNPPAKNKALEATKTELTEWQSAANPIVNSSETVKPSRFSPIRFWQFSLLLLLVSTITMILAVNYYVKEMQHNEDTKLAVLPFQFKQENHLQAAADRVVLADTVSRQLKKQLLKSGQFQYLSSRLTRNLTPDSYELLASRYRIDWILDGQIVTTNDGISYRY